MQETQEAYIFQFPAQSGVMIAEWIALERLCCPFFSFTLEYIPQHGPLLLRMAGDQGVKEFVRGNFGEKLVGRLESSDTP